MNLNQVFLRLLQKYITTGTKNKNHNNYFSENFEHLKASYKEEWLEMLVRVSSSESFLVWLIRFGSVTKPNKILRFKEYQQKEQIEHLNYNIIQ
jgi:hypothetical protein